MKEINTHDCRFDRRSFVRTSIGLSLPAILGGCSTQESTRSTKNDGHLTNTITSPSTTISPSPNQHSPTKSSSPTNPVKLIPVDEDVQIFGRSLSIDSDVIIIGAPSPVGDSAGKALIYERMGVNWKPTATLIAEDSDGADEFGSAVDINGNTAIVGAKFDEDPDIDQDRDATKVGSAYIFKKLDGNWTQTDKLIPWGEKRQWDTTAVFGESVSISGKNVIIGAWQDNFEDNEGAAYLYRESDGEFEFEKKFPEEPGERFGFSVDIDGDTAIVGDPRAKTRKNRDKEEGPYEYHRKSGRAFVYHRSNGVWSHQGMLLPADRDKDDHFGYDVAIDRNIAIIGARSDEDPNGLRSGSVYIFKRSNNQWNESAKITADDGDKDDNFGTAVDINQDICLVGAHLDEDPYGEDSGSAYVYTNPNGTWVQKTKLAVDDGDAEARFGWSVSIDGTTAVIGAYDDYPQGYKVHVYNL